MIQLPRTIRILEDGWMPIPPTVLIALGWKEGDFVLLEIMEGAILITKTHDAAKEPNGR